MLNYKENCNGNIIDKIEVFGNIKQKILAAIFSILSTTSCSNLEQDSTVGIDKEKSEIIQPQKLNKVIFEAPNKALNLELSNESVNFLNEFAKDIVEFNGLKVGQEGQLFDFIGKNLVNIPITKKIFSEFGFLMDNDLDFINKNLKEVATKASKMFVDGGWYLNYYFMSEGGNLLIKIHTEESVSSEINLLFNDIDLQTKKVYGIRDENFITDGVYLFGISIINYGEVDKKINKFLVEGRIFEDQFSNRDYYQGLINHESTHSILDEEYGFKSSLIPLDERNKQIWKIEEMNYLPSNLSQINEFISHSVGQVTSNYDLLNFMGNTILRLNNEGGELVMIENEKYGLLENYMLHLLTNLFKQKGQLEYLFSVSEKMSYLKSLGNKLIEIKDASEKHKDKTEKNRLYLSYETLKKDINTEYNTLVKDIYTQLSESDIQYIEDSFLEQSKKYLSLINQGKLKTAI